MGEQKAMFPVPGDEVPVLDEVVDPDSDRGRLVSALDELAQLIDNVPHVDVGLTEDEVAELQDSLTRRLIDRVDAQTAQLKRDIPVLVERTLREHLDKKNDK